MAKDLIIRRDARVATLVHDESELKVTSLVVLSDGLYAHGADGTMFIAHLTRPLLEDLEHCDRCVVVTMSGLDVVSTKEVRLQKEF